MSDRTIRKFFGDSERDFCLTPELMFELERKTGAGIGAICQRVFAGSFAQADMLETIRLSMIGGGESPERASELVTTYTANRPLVETHTLAVAILEALWFGRPKEEGDGKN